jgi:polar amino acid transport system substrate-binding protein
LLIALNAAGCARAGGAEPAARPTLDKSAPLYEKLPAAIREKGRLVAAYNNQYPPFTMFGSDNKTLIGASEDLRKGLEGQLGVPIETPMVNSLPALLTGIQGNRYDMSVGPIGDTPDKRGSVDFVDWVDSRGAFLTPTGNPLGFKSLEDVCGHTVAAVAGGSAEKLLQDFAAKCAGKAKPKANLQSFEDQNSMVLSVQSGRADAAYSGLAVLSYFQQQSNSKLQLVPEPADIGLGVVPQGSIVPKGSPLTQVLREALQALFNDGTYKKIMSKWGLTDVAIDAPGINMAK